MVRAVRWLLLLVAAAVCGVLAAFDGPWMTLPEANRTPLAGVYLFLWYRPMDGGWGNGASNVAPDAPRPTLGWYDSSRPEVLRAQLEEITAAGFDFVIADVTADDERMWETATLLFHEAAAYPVKVALMIDGLYREPTAVQQKWLRRVRDQFGDHPNAMRVDGKPLILFFSSFAAAGIDGVTVRNAYWSPHYQNGLNPFYRGRTPTSPTYPIDWPFWAPDPPLINGVVPVIPGYDDRLLGRPAPMHYQRDDGRRYAAQWEQALRLRPDIITVYSWNEHFEQTAIEPTDTWGRLYVDLTRKYIEQAHAGMVPQGREDGR